MAIKKCLFFLMFISSISTVFTMKNKNKRCFSVKKDVTCYECGTPKCYFPSCEKTFKNVNALLVHMRAEHANREKKTCNFPDCGKKFDSVSHLKEHMNCHLGERYFKCPTCFEKFKWSKHLTKHLKEHKKNRSSASVSSSTILKQETSNVSFNNENKESSTCEPPFITLEQQEVFDVLNDDPSMSSILDFEDSDELKALKDAEIELFLEKCNENMFRKTDAQEAPWLQ